MRDRARWNAVLRDAGAEPRLDEMDGEPLHGGSAFRRRRTDLAARQRDALRGPRVSRVRQDWRKVRRPRVPPRHGSPQADRQPAQLHQRNPSVLLDRWLTQLSWSGRAVLTGRRVG